MKRLKLLFLVTLTSLSGVFAQDLTAYYEVGNSNANMNEVIETVKNALQDGGFNIIGTYNPKESDDLAVICYTRSDLEKIALDFSDRGALAATLKIGLKKDNGVIKISMLNPIYLFYAYFVEGISKHESELQKISDEAINAMKKLGSDMKPFGGALSKNKLQKYHYKIMMPYFNNAEKLNEFSSFEEGVKVIKNNLATNKGNTQKVYELIYPDKQVAVFGVALFNKEDGEAKFLPIIGEDQLAAMPYELILQGKTASILPGRYRIALHWPELTMGTFMKIMSTPGYIKKTMEGLTE